MSNLESKIESVLLFKNEPVTLAELSRLLKVSRENLQFAISNLQKNYENRGIVLVTNGEEVAFGTNPEASELIENLQKEELSRELGRAGLETLSIILYKGPISRREIDHIRGVNSSFILRTLLVRGLIERTESTGRSYSYKATLKLLEHLGLTRREDLPEYDAAFKKIEKFMETSLTDPSTSLGVNQNG